MHTMSSMVQNSIDNIQEGKDMNNEKVYKVMRGTGGISIALGIVSIVIGVAVGVLTILNGARLLRSKSDLTF